jgi:hypothetical protein
MVEENGQELRAKSFKELRLSSLDSELWRFLMKLYSYVM